MLKSVGNPSTRYGDQTVFDGNIVIGTAGKGVDFSASTHSAGMTSELLDDYEEGTHVATATCGTSGTISLQSNTSLSYTKVGDLVHVQGYLFVGSVSSPVGSVFISLPFTALDLPGGSGSAAASVWITNVNAANVANFVARVSENTASLEIQLGDATSAQSDSAQEIKASSQIWIAATYKAA